MIVRTALVALAMGAALGALAVHLTLRWYRDRTGFTGGGSDGDRIVASDTGVAPPVLLRDPDLHLRGRPDYLVQLKAAGRTLFVPLEVKPARRNGRVYESEVLQLAAYLIALRGTVKDGAASFGYLRHAKRTFKVALTPKLEKQVGEIVQAIRDRRDAATVHRSHQMVQRCIKCAVRDHCDEALG